jgi:hypothetical protein
MINILPASYRRQQMVRNRCAQWITIIAIVLTSGCCWHWIEMREQTHLTQQLDVLSREHAPTQTMLKQVIDMRRQLKELQEQEIVAKELETQRNALTLLGVLSDAARNSKGHLQLKKIELTNFQNVGKSDKAGAAAPPPGGLLLTGVSLDNISVAELQTGLQRAGIFSKVELLKLKAREGKNDTLHDYEVRCEF